MQKPERIKINSIDNINYDTAGEISLDSWKKWDYVKYPHALVSGITGSGKTFFLYYLMLQFAKQGAEIYILDPKRSDLSSLIHYIPKGDKHVLFTPNQIASALRKINDIMNQRYEKYFMSSGRVGMDYRSIGLHPIVIFFDEVAAFMEEDKKVAKEAEAYLKQISMKARMVGIYLVLSTQKPTAEALSTAIRDQMGMRIALGNMSKPGYKMALGDDWLELPKFEKGIGKGLIMIEGNGWNTPKEFDAPYLNLENLDFHGTLANLLEANEIRFINE
ncbi:FtsK/SpoIIIE domain-containing protein [Pseudobacillus sp. 179-B 2D1 NHS]|uniref:FtsK/SpoIIIE domain-containing protein n=1 Tax=Pseudobacillus sp. 179-B 2D1 NHS TaxID=3374292 RepID=UPI003879B253